ncbi:WhiB family transcriptional regulator [Nakamurella sp.]|uniref:WhiB family transcriptional regulator n=1 Tax=Nakamurella sp. TaxID=1869182 RepID=UPI003B3B0D18
MSAPALPAPVAERWDWQLAGACRGMDVEAFFLAAGERRRSKERRIEAAKQTCRECPVIVQCREWALRTREPYGVWGGLSEEDRAEILGVDDLRYPAPRRTPATSEAGTSG